MAEEEDDDDVDDDDGFFCFLGDSGVVIVADLASKDRRWLLEDDDTEDEDDRSADSFRLFGGETGALSSFGSSLEEAVFWTAALFLELLVGEAGGSSRVDTDDFEDLLAFLSCDDLLLSKVFFSICEAESLRFCFSPVRFGETKRLSDALVSLVLLLIGDNGIGSSILLGRPRLLLLCLGEEQVVEGDDDTRLLPIVLLFFTSAALPLLFDRPLPTLLLRLLGDFSTSSLGCRGCLERPRVKLSFLVLPGVADLGFCRKVVVVSGVDGLSFSSEAPTRLCFRFILH